MVICNVCLRRNPNFVGERLTGAAELSSLRLALPRDDVTAACAADSCRSQRQQNHKTQLLSASSFLPCCSTGRIEDGTCDGEAGALSRRKPLLNMTYAD
jgi:hypothetical protein